VAGKPLNQETGGRWQATGKPLNQETGDRRQEIKTLKPESLKTSKPVTLNPSLETLNLKT